MRINKRYLTSILALVVIIMFQLFYRKSLFDASISFIEGIQEDASGFGKLWFKVFGFLGETLAHSLVMLIIFSVDSRNVGFYFVLNLTLGNFIVDIMKIVYHQPRPLMVSAHIDAFICDHGFGNPSGHAFFSSYILTTTFLHYVHSNADLMERLGKAKYGALVLLITVISFMIGFSRVYNGLQSLDQILYGWLLGVSLGFVIHQQMRRPVLDHIRTVLNLQCQSYQHRQYLRRCLITFTITLISFIVLYIIYHNSIEVQLAWILNMEVKCPEEFNGTFDTKSFIDGGKIFAPFGAYLGILWNAGQQGGTHDNINQTPIGITALRVIITMVLLIPPLLLYFYIPYSWGKFTLFALKTSFPFFIIGVFCFTYLKYILDKFGLVQRDSRSDGTGFSHLQKEDYSQVSPYSLVNDDEK